VLLALDHADRFPDALFERVNGGFLRARVTSSNWVHRQHPWSFTSGSTPLPAASAQLPPAYPEMALPVIVCDAELRVSFISQAAMMAFKLVTVDVGTKFLAVAGRLPGGVELVHAARRVIAERRGEELSVRHRGRAYLARIATSQGESFGNTLTIAYTDVTTIEAARAHAVAEQHRQTALARISERGAALATASPLYEEALAALFSNVHACTAGAIAELTGGSTHYEVVASRGLGADPMRTLRGMVDAVTLLDQAVARECVVSQHGARVPLDPLAVPSTSRSARARQALGSLTTALACPIPGDGSAIGVVVLLGRHAALGSSENRAFASSVSAVLGAAVVRNRAWRAVALELGVRRQLSGVADLKSLGECLAREFESTLGAAVELWSARDGGFTEWERRFPQSGARQSGDRAVGPWPRGLADAMNSASVLRAFEREHGEVLIPIEVNASPRFILRLHGAALRIADGELAQSLKRVGAVVGAFLERSESGRPRA
jgi:hypothetical protein